MTAQDYPVTFGYKEQDGYYYGPGGIVGPYHKGNDRSTPTGTPILIYGTDIGNTGATGLVSGPHLHTQAGTDILCQNTIDPSPLEFQPGVVVSVGNGNQWGNYITIKVGENYITYCHLSWLNVTKGQTIGGEDMPTAKQVGDIYKAMTGNDITQKDLDFYVSGGRTTADLVYGLLPGVEKTRAEKKLLEDERDNKLYPAVEKLNQLLKTDPVKKLEEIKEVANQLQETINN